MERTLSLIKPDAVRHQHIGAIIAIFEQNALRIAAVKKLRLTRGEASEFYAVHKDKPFFAELVSFMTSGPLVALVLEGENAVAKNRLLMGATNPAEAAAGTIRKLYASNITQNAVHGSDSFENALIEVAFFFSNVEIK